MTAVRGSVPRALVIATLLVAVVALNASATPGTGAPTWRHAQQLALPAGATGLAQGYLPALACPALGDCVAGGADSLAGGAVGAVVLNESSGHWTEPTTLVAPADGAAAPALTIYALACAAVGSCVAGGDYLNVAGNQEPFVASELSGVWQSATALALPANAASSSQSALVRSIACPAVNGCVAVGSYTDAAGAQRGFVAGQVNGSWPGATEVALPTGANADPFTSVLQVACAAVGSCVAVGSYIDLNNVDHGLLVAEEGGQWQNATAITPPPDASVFAGAGLSEVTCVANGPCTVLGTYVANTGAIEAMVSTAVNGNAPAASALALPANAALDPRAFFYGYGGVACANGGNCALGGLYVTAAGQYEGFFANEVSGQWRRAVQLALPKGASAAGKNGGVVALSCPQVGQCRAGAAFLDHAGRYQGLVVAEVNGQWRTGTAIALPGRATTVGVDGGVYALVCNNTTSCTATGSYLATSTQYQGFATTS